MDEAQVYVIRVKGRLAADWSAWFDGLSVQALEQGETLLIGPVADQAALHGLLTRINHLGLPLLSLCRVEPDVPECR
jgi:hypothetical protein